MSDLAYPMDLAPEVLQHTNAEELLPAEPPGTPSVVPTSPPKVPSSPVPDSIRQQPFYIDIPYLSLEEKVQYGPVPDVVVESDDELDLIELRSVVGEYTEDGSHYYFAAGSGGLARRVSVELLFHEGTCLILRTSTPPNASKRNTRNLSNSTVCSSTKQVQSRMMW